MVPLTVIGAAVCVLGGCAGHRAPPEAGPAIVTVGDAAITQGQLIKAMRAANASYAKARGVAAGPFYRPPAFATCVRDQRRSWSKGLRATDRELRRHCARRYERFRRNTLGTMVEAIWTEQEAARLEISIPPGDRGRAILASRLSRRAMRRAPRAPDEAVVRYYARHGSYFVQPERRDLDAIVSWRRRAGRAVVDDLRRGADWAEVADRHAASGAVTKLAQRTRVDLPDELARRVFSARVDRIVGPVRAPDGWYVVAVRRIVPRFKMTLDQSRPYIRHLLNQDLRQGAVYDSQRRLLTSYRKRTHCLGALRVSACVNGPAPTPPAPFRGQLDKPVIPALEPSGGR